MKKAFIVFTAAALLLTLAACGQAQGESVSVQSVSMLAGDGSVGLVSRYAGVVVSGQTAELKKDANKTILEILVEEGDWVEKGDVLFTYDTEAMELELEKMRLELEGFESTIASAQEEIPRLEQQMQWAGAADKLAYSLQIQSLKADIRESQYKKTLKEREISVMEASMSGTQVTSPLSGRVMSVQDPNNENMNMEDASKPFVTVMDMTTYRVEGNINELNVGSLTVGMNVLVRSRMDSYAVWTGTVDSIDWENPVNGNQNNNYYYYAGASDTMTTASKYPFYITLSDVTGLILGQHVYIEPDYGQQEEQEGLWLPAWYIVDADSSPWVWRASARDRLEKHPVTLGEYDAEQEKWLVTGGLTEDDYLAFPDESLTPGQPTARYDEESFGDGEGTASAGNATVFASGGNAVTMGVG